MKPYAILGAGGFAREVFWHILDMYPLAHSNLVFVDDVTSITHVSIGNHVIKVIKNWTFDRDYQFVIGVGNPSVKKLLVTKAVQKGLLPAATIIHPRAIVQNVKVGVGGVITPGCIITTDIIIGDYVILNLNTTVGHDVVIGDYCTINPGVSISGDVTLGNSVLLGTGSVIREKTSIADGVTVGAGSVVVKPIPEQNATVVGVPATKLMR